MGQDMPVQPGVAGTQVACKVIRDRGQIIKSLTSLAVEVELYLRDFDHEPKHKMLGEKRREGWR